MAAPGITRQDAVAGALAVAVIVLACALVLLCVLFAQYRETVQAACQSVAAPLDLVDWVRVCR